MTSQDPAPAADSQLASNNEPTMSTTTELIPNTSPVVSSSNSDSIPPADKLSPIPKYKWDDPGTIMGKGPFYYKRKYFNESNPTFFKITNLRVVSPSVYYGEKARQYYEFGYYDDKGQYRNAVDIPIESESVFELTSDRERIKADALAKAETDYADLAARMKQVTNSELKARQYAYYYDGSDGSKYVVCEIIKVPFWNWGNNKIKIELDGKLKDVDIKTLFRPTPKVAKVGGGRRWKKTKKGGYKHKKSNRKQKYHSRKVRKPKNRNGRTYSKRRS
jgi:hypothetical protein